MRKVEKKNSCCQHKILGISDNAPPFYKREIPGSIPVVVERGLAWVISEVCEFLPFNQVISDVCESNTIYADSKISQGNYIDTNQESG